MNGGIWGWGTNLITSTLNKVLSSYENAIRVIPRDTAEPVIIAKFNKVKAGTILAIETAIEDRIITVADATGFSVGDYLIMYSTVIDRYYVGYILEINGNNLTLDTPVDAIYPVGGEFPTVVAASTTNMNVDGSTIPQIFGLRGTPVVNPLNLTFDITRIIFHCQTSDSVDLSKFGDIANGLLNGLILRRRNQEYNNIFNIKTNGDLSGICYDFTVTSASNPQQGQNGFYARLTFASQGKLGSVIRLKEGTDLEFIIQDNLTGINLLEVVAEGHVLEDK